MIDIPLFEKQKEFISKKERTVLFDAGIGSGKTHVGCLWLALQVLSYPKTRWYMVARDFGQLRDATDFVFREILEDWLHLKQGIHYTRVGSPRLEYSFSNGATVMGRGAKNYDSSFRGPSVSGALCDELDYWEEAAWTALLGRIRKPPELIRCVSSPKGFNFVHDHFYALKNDSKAVVRATTYSNPLLSEEYIESLKNAYSPKMFQQEVLAERLNLKQGAVYDEFNRKKHVKKCKNVLTDKDQLYFFTDYNISNYCGVYMVFKDNTIYCIGEEHLKFQGSRVMATTVRQRYPGRPIIVVGDSTGNNKRDVAIDRTNYEHFRREGLLTKNFKNPPVESRIIAAQSHLYHNRIIVDPSCTTLIKDLELLGWKEDGSGIDKSDINLSHAADAWNYGVWYFLPIKGRTSGKVIME